MKVSMVWLLSSCAIAAAARAADSAPAPAVAVASTSAPRLARVAVPNMVATGVDAALAKTLTEVLTIEVLKTPGIEAIGMADIEAVLNHEQQKALLGCDDASCIAEIGGALGVDALVSSKIGLVGETYVLSIRLNDTRTAKPLGSAYETVTGKPDALINVIRSKVPEVMRSLARKETAVAAGVADSAGGTGHTNTGASLNSGSRQLGAPFRVIWPAIGVIATGLVAIAAGGVVGGLAVANWVTGSDHANQRIGGHVYYAPGAQKPFADMNQLAWAALITLGVGGAIAAGGIAWQFIGGVAGDAEARP